MNVHSHMSAGNGPDQGGVPQQDGNAVPPNQKQNLVGGAATAAGIGGGGVTQQHNMLIVDPDLLRARGYMRDKILAILLHRQPQTIDDSQRTRFRDISKRLEEGLFKIAPTKEEYLNMETLEHRLGNLIKDRIGNSHNQRHQQLVNSSSSVGTMLPTPGMSQSGNSSLMVTSSVDSSTIAASGGNTVTRATINTGSLLSTDGMHSNSFNRSDGLSNGCQQPAAHFSIGSGGNVPSMGVQRITTQMESVLNLESSDNVGGFSAVEYTVEQHNEVMHSQVLPESQTNFG